MPAGPTTPAAQSITSDNTINSLNWNLNGNLDLTTRGLTLVSGGYIKQNNNANSLLGTTGYVTAGAGDGVLTPLNVFQNHVNPGFLRRILEAIDDSRSPEIP